MPTISELPAATQTTTSDLIPVSQNGTTRNVTVSGLLASTQPTITLAEHSILGRSSLGPGGPETLQIGTGLTLTNGTLATTGMATPTSAPLLASNAGGTLTPVVLGSGAAISSGTLNITGGSGNITLPASAPVLASSARGVAIALTLGANVSSTNGTLNATTDASVTSSLSALGTSVSTQGTSLTSLVGSVTAATGSLTALNTTVSAQGTTLASHTSSLSTLGTAVASNATSLSSLGTTTTSNTASLSVLQTSVAGHTSSITTLTSSVGSVSAAASSALALATAALPAAAVPTSSPLLSVSSTGTLRTVTLGSNLSTSVSGSTITLSASGTLTGDASSQTVMPYGTTSSTTVAKALARTVYIEDFGGLADCVLSGDHTAVASGTDNGPALQAAITTLGSAGGTVRMRSGFYWFNTNVTFNLAHIHLIGNGYGEGFSPGSGTWIIQSNSAAGFHVFTLGGTFGATGSPSGLGSGTTFRELGFFQVHPNPSATAGIAWTPTAYDYVINIQNTAGHFCIDNCFFGSINKGISAWGCGHFVIGRVFGQWYTNAIYIGHCEDTPYIGTIRSWGYQDSNINRVTYTRNSLDLLLLGRCDGAVIGDLFCYDARSVVHCIYEAAITSQANANADTPGGFASGSIKSLDGDQVQYGFWWDNINCSGNSPPWQIDIMTVNGLTVNSDNSVDSGACAIYINGQNRLVMMVASAYFVYYYSTPIRIAGNTNELFIGMLKLDQCNQGGTTKPAIDVGDNGNTNLSNRCVVGTVLITNANNATLFGSSLGTASFGGNGSFNAPQTFTDQATFAQEMGPRYMQSTSSLVASTARSFRFCSGTNEIALMPNVSAGSYNPLVRAGDSVILADVGAAGNTGAICLVPHTDAAIGFRASSGGTVTISGTAVSITGPVMFSAYAVGSLPSAVTYNGSYITVTGQTTAGVGPLARSDGTNWRFVGNGALVA